MIGLEPACVSAFRDELVDLFPDNDLARQAVSEQTLFFTEFLDRNDIARCRSIGGEALVQMHCHHHAVIKPDAEQQSPRTARHRLRDHGLGLLRHGRLRSASRSDKYEVSHDGRPSACCCRRCAKRPHDTVILANGFSCREQIEQGSERKTPCTSPRSSRSI